MDVFVLITYDPENCDGIDGIGRSAYSSLQAAVDAVVGAIVDDNTVEHLELEGSTVEDGRFERMTTPAEARSCIRYSAHPEFGGTVAWATDPDTEVEYQIEKVEVQP